MPMSRYQIRNEYSLADPELYGVADKDDPEALLEAVAMAGLVGVLRQLGDLAEFAAEVFHDLHEEVMATATRGHGLMVRVKQLETEFPPIEKAFLSQTSPSAFFSNTGTAWHPSLHMNQNLITGGDLPRFIMDSYEECRGPPRLFLLDKFDVAGAGACLKRYTDPSFFKVEASSYGLSSAEVQKEKRYRKSKQKKGSRLRNAGTPEVLPGSHAKLQQLFLEDRVENGVTDPARLVKLKRRLNGYPFDSKSGKSFMEIFINTSSPEDKVVHEVAYGSSAQELQPKTTSESGAAVSSLRESMSIERTAIEPFNYMDEVSEDLRDRELSLGTNQYPLEVADEKEIAVDGESKPDGNEDGYQSDDVASEVDNYMDALATMESEIDTETEFKTKYNIGVVGMEKHGTDHDANEKLLHVQFPDSQSTGNSDTSEDGNNSDKKGSSHLSYSDNGSTAAENMPDDVTAEVSLTTRVCEAEVSVMSTEKVLMSEKRSFSQDYEPPNHDFSDDISNEVNDVPSYAFESELPCSSLPHSDSFPTHITPDGVAKGTLSGPQMVKIFSNHDELDSEFIKTEEYSRTRGNNIPWTSRHSRVPSQTKDDEPLADKAFAENCILDKLDGDPSVLSNASIHISDDIFEVIPKKYDCESSVDDSLESECEEGSHTENFDENQISTLHSVISHAEVEPFVPAVLDSEISNTVLEPEVVNSVDNVCPSPRVITVDSNFASDGYKNSSIVEQQGSEWADDIPSIPISAAVDACHEEEAPNRVLCEADSGEMGETTHNISLIGSETTAVTKTSNFVDSGAPESFVGSPVSNKVDNVKVSDIASRMAGTDATALTNLDVPKTTGRGSLIDEKQTEEDQADNITVAGIAANRDSDADNVDSTSRRNVTAEDTHFSQKPDQHGSEDFAELLPQKCNESVEKPPLVKQDNTSPDLDSVRYETGFGDHSDFKMVSYIPESNLQPVKENALSSSSVLSNQNIELVSSKESNFRKHSGDILLSSTHHLPGTRTHSDPMLTLETGKVDLEHLHVDESKPKEIFPSERLLCLDHLDDRSSDAYSEPCFVASKGIVQLNKQADSLAVEPSYGDNASLLDKNHTDCGENIFTSPRSSSMPSPSELSQPSSDEVDISAQARDELSAVHSGFPLLLEVPQVDLPQMPPLPPLPPVQWRIGRPHQHASLPSERDLVQNNFGMVPPMFPAKTSNNAQKGYETNMDDLLPPMPILPRPALKDEDHLHDNEHFRGTAAHFGSLPVQMPLTSIVTSKNVPISDDTCNTDPCVTLSSTVNDSSSQDIHVEVAETMQSSCTPSSTIETSIDASNLSGSVPSPLSQMQPDSCSEPESTSVRSEIRLIKFLDTNVAQPTVADEHPKDVSTNVEGENVWSTSNSSYPAPEDGKLNGNRQLKLPRPRSPLIDAVAAHDKSMLKKVTERSRPDVQKVEERDSLLEQIRAKSFNLKPAVVTRPSIQGPKTNLRVAAILEKANAIRQAFAGSDDDEDDDDSWSES